MLYISTILRFFLVMSLQFLLDYLDVSEKTPTILNFLRFWSTLGGLAFEKKAEVLGFPPVNTVTLSNDRNSENIRFPMAF